MNTTTLKVAYHDDYGITGVVPANLRMSREELTPASDGPLVAHDVIEHQRGTENIGGAGDELMALGAAWYTRGSLADWNRKSRVSNIPPELVLGVDISQCYMRWVTDGQYMGMEKVESNAMDPDTLKDMFREARKEARHYDEYTKANWKTFIKDAAKYMSRGYELQDQRYGGSVNANRVFWNIADAIDEAIFDTGQDLDEWMEWELSWDDTTATVEEIYDEDDQEILEED